MFKKAITFEDFNGETRTQEFYFHMSKAELLEMIADGSAILERIKRIVAAQDGKAILKEFRALIEASCGIRSEDGARFLKTPEAKSELLDSPAYDELLMELSTDAEASAAFVNQLIPQKMQQEMKAQLEKQGTTQTVDPFKQPTDDDPRPAWLKEGRNPTDKELMNMSKDEMVLAFRHRQPPV